MTPEKSKAYLNKILSDARKRVNQLKGYKASITKKFNSGDINEADRAIKNKQVDDARVVLKQYIEYHENKLKTMKGSGIRRKHRGGNVLFFNNPKELLKKLELIIGERLAGNTSIEMHNMGVAILDTLLKTFAINKPQNEKLYKKIFQNLK